MIESQGLRSAGVEGEYRSDRCDVVEDFYVPALRQAEKYDRAVGYFTAPSSLSSAGGSTSSFGAADRCASWHRRT